MNFAITSKKRLRTLSVRHSAVFPFTTGRVYSVYYIPTGKGVFEEVGTNNIIHHIYIVRRRSSKELSFVESGLRFCCNDFVVKILLYGFVSQSLFSLCSSPGSWQLKLRYECTKHCSFSGCFYLLPGFHFQFMPKGTFKLCCFYPATPRLSHLSI